MSTRTRLARPGSWWFVPFCLACGASTAWSAEDRSARGVFLPTESDQAILWQRIEKARDEKNWDAVLDGLSQFAELVARPELNTVLDGGGGMSWGIRQIFRRLTTSLPPDQLERYKARLDPLATSLWEKSRARATPEEHRRLRRIIIRDLGESFVYPQALEEEALEAIETGDWLQGQKVCEAYLALDPPPRNAADLVRARLLLAQIYAVLGSEKVAAQIQALRETSAAPSFAQLPATLRAQVKAILDAKISPPSASAAEAYLESPLEPPLALRSSAGSADSGFRAGSVIWERRAAESKLRSFVAERARSSSAASVPLPYYPVARGGLIVFQHSDRISAYSTSQGREIWSLPLDPSRENPAGVHAPLLGRDVCYFSEAATLRAVQLSDGSGVWQRTFVYDRERKALHALEGPLPPEEEARDAGQEESGDDAKTKEKPRGAVEPGEKEPTGEVEPPDEGEKPARDEEEGAGKPAPPGAKAKGARAADKKPEAQVRISYGLSPAIEIQDGVVLSVQVRIGRESLHFLACLDSRGDEVWTSALGSIQGGNFLNLGGSCSVPLRDGDAIYQLTNAGILAAVDARDGTILWITSYPGLSLGGKREAMRDENRWQANPIIPVGIELIIAPQDSPFLLGIHKTTGEVLWRAPRESRSALVGADSEACFVVGRDAAAIAHSGPQRGKAIWRFRAPGAVGSCEPAGRAFLSEGLLLVPGRDALLCLSARDGRLLSQTLWDYSGIGGNLLLTRVGGASFGARPDAYRLAVASPGGALVYSSYEAEASRIASLPADKTETLLEKAKFHLKNTELEAGIAVLRTWKESAPPAPPPNSALDHLQLDVAELIEHLVRGENAGKHEVELLRFRVSVERTPARRVSASIELASRLEQRGDAAGALQALHDALAFDNPATNYSPDGSIEVPSAPYIRERIRTLRKATPDGARVFAQVNAAARETLRSAQNKGRSPASYLEVIRLFPFTPAAAEAYLDVSRLFRDGQSHDLAVSALESYLDDFPEGSDARSKDAGDSRARTEELVRVKLLSAELLRRSGRVREARERYLECLEKHPEARVQGIDGARPGETVEELVKPLLHDPSLIAAATEEPATLKFPVRMAWRSPADLQATKKTFLVPAGASPPALKASFLTQSEDLIELRSLDTGLPLWRAYLEMIPGFEVDLPSRGRGFSMARSGRRAFSGRFVQPGGADAAPMLVLQDERNVFAMEPGKGTVRWHVPIGPEKSVQGPDDPFRPHLREKIRGALVTDVGVFAATSSARLLRLNLQGELAWEQTKLGYSPNMYPPFLLKDELFEFSQLPLGIHLHSAETGLEIQDEKVAELSSEALKTPLLRAPIDLGNGRLLLVHREGLRCLDLAARNVAWKLLRKGTIEEVFYFPEYPEECVVVSNSPANSWPSVTSVSLRDGSELWKYERFPPARATLSIVREKNRFYIVHGVDQWMLLALQARDSLDGEKPIIEALWQNDVPLGHNEGAMAGRLHVSGDTVFFLDTDNRSVSVFDKLLGTSRGASASSISRFTAEKEDCAISIQQGKLVILADGGDCAFESTAPGVSGAGLFLASKTLLPPTGPEGLPIPPLGGADMPLGARSSPAWTSSWLASWSTPGGGIDLLRQYLLKPGSLESTSQLALQYFKGNDLETAIEILNRALLSEDLLEGNGAEKRYLLSYLLDGIKEEHLKESVPRIACHRFQVAPSIDGELNDAWDISTRIHLNSPKNVGTIPGPGQLRDWEGEEDLSAILYTGWDDKYFYFALDVSDDVLYPYDKDAESWKGDCLIIGLDPTNDEGWHQRGNDQLMTLALTIPKRNKLDKLKKNAAGEEEEEENEDEDETRKPAGLFSVKKKDDDAGAIYEVGLPWSSFFLSPGAGAAPPTGYSFGLSLLLTDDDTGQGATKTLSLNPCHLLPRNQKNSPGWRFIIPYFFPKVTLE